MSIPFFKYVNIVSGVGAASAVAQRALIGRLISQNSRINPDSVLEFDDAAGVGLFFGTSSEEYLRAVFYFSYVNPSISAPRKISFSRYTPTGAAPAVFGFRQNTTLAAFNAVTAGTIAVVINGATYTTAPFSLAAAASLAAVATAIQAALVATDVVKLSLSTVSYNPTTATFSAVLQGTDGAAVNATLAVPDLGSPANTLVTLLGWLPSQGAVVTNGQSAQTASEALSKSIDISNNFGSFLFTGDDLDLSVIATVAALNAGLNVAYMYMVPVTDYLLAAPALLGFSGTALTLTSADYPNEFPEMVPMMQLAATDYTRRNATQNYMFKQFALTPLVTSGTTSDELDSYRVNYYGRTQQAGRVIDFYQRGYLMGPVTAPLDMNTYGNEQWLKDSLGAALMSLLLSEGRVPANESGRGQILAVVQDSIDQGLNNGVISVGKRLNTQQKLYITEQTGDELAWHQVQDIGYYVDAQIVSYVGPGGQVEYKAVYSLLYSKDDAVRKVDGQHILI